MFRSTEYFSAEKSPLAQNIWTALVRPLVGASWLDFIERFANWADPLALYYFYRLTAAQREGKR